jgi:uncharacterized glyoxalase superfamily protein PhnB/DNA-binding XRE family transcriptional regulator
MEEQQAGAKIRSLRERKAWTQEHLAGAARISTRTVQRAEEGVMSAETRAAIAGALDVSVERLAPEPKPPQGWPKIAPVLCYDDSKAAVPWLVEAFGFTVRESMTGVDGQVLHAELVLGDGVIMVGHTSSSPRWASPRSLGRTTQFLYVFVGDLDSHYARAKAAGAVIVTEPETSYGQRRYRALDLEGHEWCFSAEVAS